MMVVGVLTLTVAARGSVELAGLTSAMVGLGAACCGPLIGAAADRFGQRPTLLFTGIANSLALALLAWIALSPLPDWLLLAAGCVLGATAPQISPMSRSRLVLITQQQVSVTARPRTLQAALSYESAVDEVIFVFGPLLVGVLATSFGAATPILAAAALTCLSVTAFALHHTSPPARPREPSAEQLAPARELWRAPLGVTVWGIFALGLFFGATLTSLTAFMQVHGAAEQAGLLYGVMGVGSALLAIGVTWFPPRFTLRYRWLASAGLLLAATIGLQYVESVTQMLLALALLGFGIGPMLVTIFGFAAARTPRGRSATVMSMLGSAVILGQSLAAALTGSTAERIGSDAALLLPLIAAALCFLAACVNWLLTPTSRAQ